MEELRINGMMRMMEVVRMRVDRLMQLARIMAATREWE